MKIKFILPFFLLTLVFCQSNYAQRKAEDLRVSIDLGKNVFNLTTHRKFRVRIENKTNKIIKFNSQNVGLGLSPAVKNNIYADGYFTFVKINADEIKPNESIEVETQLNALHWYSTRASHYTQSDEPNLDEIIRIFPGEYQVSASMQMKSKDENNYPAIATAGSESLNITLKK